jgi:hypothetical protein
MDKQRNKDNLICRLGTITIVVRHIKHVVCQRLKGEKRVFVKKKYLFVKR